MQQAKALPPNPLAELKKREKTAQVYTLEEYLKREEASTERHEYHNGKIVKLPKAKGPHNVISANLIFGISKCIASNDADLTVFTSNQKVYLPKLNYGLYPDALVVSREPAYWDQNQVLLINPLLIVEVLSKRTRNYDLVEKFQEYQTLASFEEYVLVEQDKIQVQTRFREEPDLWRFSNYDHTDEVIPLRSIGCSISMKDIYRKVF
jgi:Uma2 family endonuclease